MTFKHKLSKRLALLRDAAVVLPVAAIFACTLGDNPISGPFTQSFSTSSNNPSPLTDPSSSGGTVLVQESFADNAFASRGWYDNTSLVTTPINLTRLTENRSTAGCNGVVEVNMYNECYNAPPWYNDKKLDAPQPYFLATPGVPGYKGNWNHVETYFQINSIVGGV